MCCFVPLQNKYALWVVKTWVNQMGLWRFLCIKIWYRKPISAESRERTFTLADTSVETSLFNFKEVYYEPDTRRPIAELHNRFCSEAPKFSADAQFPWKPFNRKNRNPMRGDIEKVIPAIWIEGAKYRDFSQTLRTSMLHETTFCRVGQFYDVSFWYLL